MKTLTAEHVEAKKQRLRQLADEAKQLHGELAEAGVIALSDDDLEQAAGGALGQVIHISDPFQPPTYGELGDVPDYPTLV